MPPEEIAYGSSAWTEDVPPQSEWTVPSGQAANGRRRTRPNVSTPYREPAELTTEIERSRLELSSLEADYDSYGGEPPLFEVIQRAHDFLRELARVYWARRQRNLPVPRVSPIPTGGVGIYWSQPSFRLLILVPADAHRDAEFTFWREGAPEAKSSRFSLAVPEALIGLVD